MVLFPHQGEDQNAAQTSVATEATSKTPTNGCTPKTSSPVVPLMSAPANVADTVESCYDATSGTWSEASNVAASARNAQDMSSYQIPDSMMSMMMDAWGRKNEFYCEVCDMDCKSKDAYGKHLLGAKHKKKFASKANFHTGGEDQTMDLETHLTTLGEPIVGLECVQVTKV